MPDGPVVLNNTPLVALWSLDRLDLLRDLFGNVLVPHAVRQEFLAVASKERQASLDDASWITTTTLSDPRQAFVYVGLDLGEAEVLALALERNARLVVIDERKGRRYAQRLGLPMTGTIGLLLLAKENGILPAVTPEIAQLQKKGLFLASDLVTKVQELADEKQ